MDGLKAAFGRMQEAGARESNDNSSSGGKHDAPEGAGQHHSIHHLNHGKTHSVHKISHEGKAESSSHEAGEGENCPLCGSPVGE